MFTIIRHVGSKCHTCHREIASVSVVQMTQVAAFKNLSLPKPKEIDLPEKYRRLYLADKTPQFVQGNQQIGAFKIRRLPRDLSLIRGPELVHNKLQYGHIGIQALSGGYLQYTHMNNIRITLNRLIDEKKSFAVWRLEYPWRPYTRKPASVRMGAGKGGIKDFSVPVKANRMLLEVGGDIELQKLWRILKHLSGQTPMNSRVVTAELLKEEEEVEKKLTKTNVNPFSFGDCARKTIWVLKRDESV